MEQYIRPVACSLSPTSRSRKPACPMSVVKVDLRAKKLENGEDYLKLNPRGRVPALGLDSSKIVAEGPVIVQMIADKASAKALGAGARQFRAIQASRRDRRKR